MWVLPVRSRTWVGPAHAAAGAALLVWLMLRFDVLPVLAAAASAVGLGLMILSPNAAVILASTLIYANIPAAFRDTFPAAQAVAGAFAVLLGLAFIRRVVLRDRLVFDRTFVLMLALLGVMLISALGAVDRGVALARVGQFAAEGLMLYWLLLQVIRSRALLRGVMWAVTVTAALLACLSFYQVVSGNYDQQFGGLASRQLRHEQAAAAAGRTTEAGSAQVRVADRAAGPVSDPNRHAQNLLLALPLAIYLIGRRTPALGRLWALGAAGVIGLGIVLTYSRGAFVAVGLVLVAAGAWRIVHRVRLAAAIVAVTLFVGAVAPTYRDRVGTIVNSIALLGDNDEDDTDGAMRGRATEMLAAWRTFTDHPVLGVGPGQYTPFYSVDYQQRWDVKFRSLSVPREPHNLFLNIGAELGVVGLTVFVGLVAWLARDLLRARRFWTDRDPDLSRLATAFLLSIVVYIGCGLFLHLAYERYFWFLLGIAGAGLEIMRQETRRAAFRAVET
jgi:putative inorganic carbon (HCO3(-)) transporter